MVVGASVELAGRVLAEVVTFEGEAEVSGSIVVELESSLVASIGFLVEEKESSDGMEEEGVERRSEEGVGLNSEASVVEVMEEVVEEKEEARNSSDGEEEGVMERRSD